MLRAPCRMVSVQHDPDCIFVMAKQARVHIRVCRTIWRIWVVSDTCKRTHVNSAHTQSFSTAWQCCSNFVCLRVVCCKST